MASLRGSAATTRRCGELAKGSPRGGCHHGAHKAFEKDGNACVSWMAGRVNWYRDVFCDYGAEVLLVGMGPRRWLWQSD